MKRLFAVVLVLTLFTACGGEPPLAEPEPEQTTTTPEEATPEHSLNTVKIISYGTEYLPLEHWVCGLSDGVAVDAFGLPHEQVLESAELPTVIYSTDFNLSVTGENLMSCSWTLFDLEGNRKAMGSGDGKLGMPDEDGEYLLDVYVFWGEQDNYAGIQYFFKIVIKSGEPEPDHGKIRLDWVEGCGFSLIPDEETSLTKELRENIFLLTSSQASEEGESRYYDELILKEQVISEEKAELYFYIFKFSAGDEQIYNEESAIIGRKGMALSYIILNENSLDTLGVVKYTFVPEDGKYKIKSVELIK